MGYVLKTTFWLGLVISAMPLRDSEKLPTSTALADSVAVCAKVADELADRIGPTADSYRDPAKVGCASFAGSTDASRARAASSPAPQSAHRSGDTLSASDRLPPWKGPSLPAPRSKAV